MFCPDVFIGAVYAEGEIDDSEPAKRRPGLVIAATVDEDGAWTGDFVEGEAAQVEPWAVRQKEKIARLSSVAR